MVLMDRYTGKTISDYAHLRQSINTILTTSIGSRVILRDFGASLYDLLDAPMNSAFLLSLRSSIVEAIEKYEPRIAIKKVDVPVFDSARGKIQIRIQGVYIPNGELITLDNLEFSTT